MANGAAFVRGAEDGAFLRIEHLSILAASRGPGNIPFAARALGLPAFSAPAPGRKLPGSRRSAT